MEKIQPYLLLLFIPLIFTNVTLDPGIHIRFIALCLFCLAIFISRFKKDFIFLTRPVLIFFGIYTLLLVNEVIGLIYSPVPADGLFVFSKQLLFLILIYIVTFFFDLKKEFSGIARAVSILGFIISITVIVQLLLILKNGRLIIPFSTYFVYVIYGHRNLVSEMLFLTMAFPVYLIFRDTKRWKYFSAISFSLILFSIGILSNRAVWLAVLSGTASLIVVWIVKRKEITKEILRNKKVISAVAIAIFSVCIFYFSFSDTSTLKEHTLSMADKSKGSTRDRINLWSKSIMLIKEHPIRGHGLNGWKIGILKYGNDGLVSENNRSFYQRPHNDFIWFWAEIGITGMLLYLSLFIFIIYESFYLMKASYAKDFLSLIPVVLFSISGFLMISLVSFPLERIEHNIFLALFFGIILNILQQQSSKNILKVSSRVNWAFVFILLILITPGIQRFISETHISNAIDAKKKKNYLRCSTEAQKALSWCYTMDPYSTPVSWYIGLAHFQMNRTDEAFRDFSAAAKLNPYHIHVLNNIGTCYEIKGNHNLSAEYFNKALKIAPNFTDAALNLTAVYFNQGKTDSAAAIFFKIQEDSSLRYRKTLIVLVKAIVHESAMRTGNNKIYNIVCKNNYYFCTRLKDYIGKNKDSTDKYLSDEQFIEKLQPPKDSI